MKLIYMRFIFSILRLGGGVLFINMNKYGCIIVLYICIVCSYVVIYSFFLEVERIDG